ncbi:hypothetical protein Mapa_016606 [Marchantia paleacea]|nr:hypothetical protein Mapa_016606 [Marchantia paleacea]
MNKLAGLAKEHQTKTSRDQGPDGTVVHAGSGNLLFSAMRPITSSSSPRLSLQSSPPPSGLWASAAKECCRSKSRA